MKKLFLIGFMGSGKTYLAEKLATYFDVPALDLDELIEQQNDRTIGELFAERGETEFRKLEQKALKHTVALPAKIIATGGGTPCFEDNMEWINQSGLSVFLDPSENVLFERLHKDKARRPLISGQDDASLRQTIASLLAHRRPYYERADLQVTDSDTLTDLDFLAQYLDRIRFFTT